MACNGAAAFSEYVAASAKLCQPVQQAGPQEVALVLSAVTACAALEVGWRRRVMPVVTAGLVAQVATTSVMTGMQYRLLGIAAWPSVVRTHA